MTSFMNDPLCIKNRSSHYKIEVLLTLYCNKNTGCFFPIRILVVIAIYENKMKTFSTKNVQKSAISGDDKNSLPKNIDKQKRELFRRKEKNNLIHLFVLS
jgi:hypothetical protein